MTRWAAVWLAAVMTLAGCDGGGGGGAVNLSEDGGLDGVVAAEVALLESDGGRRWVTINDPADATRLAATLDDATSLVDRPACAPDFEVTFFTDSGARVDYAYGCGGEDLLWGPEDSWEGRAAVAPGSFTSEVAGYLALLDEEPTGEG